MDGVVQPIKATQPFIMLNPPPAVCDPSMRDHSWARPPRAPLKASLLDPLKAAPLVQENTVEDTSEAISLSMTPKPTLKGSMFKYLHLFFHPCSSISRFYS